MSASAIERLHDLDPLLLAHRDVLDARVRIDRESETLRELSHAVPCRRVIEEEPALARLAPEHDVLRDRHHGDQHEVLVNHADPVLNRVFRGVKHHWIAADPDLAIVGSVQAVENVHQRRLARPVLPE